jgi:hypothetical protein
MSFTAVALSLPAAPSNRSGQMVPRSQPLIYHASFLPLESSEIIPGEVGAS